MAGNESSYGVLIDKNNRRRTLDANLARLEKTKSILSGGMRPRPLPLPGANPSAAPMAPPPPAPFYPTQAPPSSRPAPVFSSTLPSGFYAPPRPPQSPRIFGRPSAFDQQSSASSSHSRFSVNSEVRAYIDAKIKEYGHPEAVRRILNDDLIARMKYLNERGAPLPKNYVPEDHNMDENEFRLLQQQVQKTRNADKQKMSGFLKTAAISLRWFCSSMNIQFVKLKYLPDIIKESIEDGEFDDVAEGLSEAMRGTVLDHPLYNAGIKFLEKVSEAHDRAEEENEENWEKKENKRKNRREELLNEMRRAKAATRGGDPPPARTKTSPSPLDDLPPPRRRADYDTQSSVSSATQTTDSTTITGSTGSTGSSSTTSGPSEPSKKKAVKQPEPAKAEIPKEPEQASTPKSQPRRGMRPLDGATIKVPAAVQDMIQQFQEPMREMANMMSAPPAEPESEPRLDVEQPWSL